MATTKANLIKGQYTLVSQGGKPVLLQAHNDEVRIAFSDAQPTPGNSVFHLLQARKTLFFKYNDTQIWAMPLTQNSSMVLTEGADRVTIESTGGHLTTGPGLITIGNEIRYNFIGLNRSP